MRIVGGAANNQLTDGGIGELLHDKGIPYVPDYIINSGGLIQVADELEGFDRERAMRKTAALSELLQQCFALADEMGVPPLQAADRRVQKRIARLARIGRIYLPPTAMGRDDAS